MVEKMHKPTNLTITKKDIAELESYLRVVAVNDDSDFVKPGDGVVISQSYFSHGLPVYDHVEEVGYMIVPVGGIVAVYDGMLMEYYRKNYTMGMKDIIKKTDKGIIVPSHNIIAKA